MAIRAEWRRLLARGSRRKASRQSAVRWQPHSDDASAMAWLRSRNPHVTFVAGVVTGSLLIGAAAWLLEGHTFKLPSLGETQAASTPPRYAPLDAAEQPSAVIRAEAGDAITSSEQTAHLVADDEIVELQIGRRIRLAARIDDADLLKPETLALISGLPEGVQLSDGIKINTQLWMLRPDLLSSVEVEAVLGPVGRYPVTLELRTPEGDVVSSAQTTLVIVAAVEDNSPPAEREGAEAAPLDGKPAVSTAATPTPAKSETVRATRPRVDAAKPAKKRLPTRTVVTRPEPVFSPKPVQKSRPVRPDTGASVPPIVAQGPQSQPQQKLVWPGDNPRAVYTQNPPFFLGAVPNAQSQSQPAPAQDEDWHKRVFNQAGQ